ncbi:MAG: FGGY family carbohydrate kinase [Pyrinomonadaceae bacterium]
MMLMKNSYVLAIDQGTTGTTVLIFDRDVSIKGRAYSEFTQIYPQPGWVEHDPEEIWSVTMRVVAEALAAANIQASDLDSIGITNQRETTVVWDRATGAPVHHAIVWQDRRTAGICDDLKERALEQDFRSRTGLVVDAYFSGTKIKWLLDNKDGLRARAEKGDVCFGTIDSWLLWKLSGGRVHATDYSNASRTLIYNIYDLRWDSTLLETLGDPSSMLPEVKPSSHVYAVTDPRVFLGASVPIAGIAGDQQSALFGQACYGEGRAKIPTAPAHSC